MDPVVEIAMVVAAGTVLSAIFTGSTVLLQTRLNNAQRQRERNEDYARQDRVADAASQVANRAAAEARDVATQAATAARLLHDAQQVTLDKTEEVKVAAEVSAAAAMSQFKQIHTLVNSDKTKALESLLDQTRLTLAVMRRMVAMDRDAGRNPSADDLAAIKNAEGHIAEYELNLADRAVQAAAVETEKAAAQKDGVHEHG